MVMSVLTIRIPDNVVYDLEVASRQLKVSRNEYIRRSILLMNETWQDNERKRRIAEASLKTRGESMIINSEFDMLEYGKED